MGSIEKGNIEFVVESGVLVKMIPMVNETIDAYIPKKLSDDVEIYAIGKHFCKGRYGKITIDNDITKIGQEAFYYCFAEEIVWSNGCNIIPERCFKDSIIGRISNIDNVEIIEQRAFDTSSIKELDWPSSCDVIPRYCFNNSMLEHISGINNVKSIYDSAFAYCDIEEIIWPSGCKKIPDSCFYRSKLKRILNIQDVTEIGPYAFALSKIESFIVPDGVKKISMGDFAWNYSLKSVICHDRVSLIEGSVFMGTGLKKFDWPLDCSVIPASCFRECSSFTDLFIRGGIISVEEYAFSYSGILYFDWPKTCNRIPSGCFRGSQLRDIVIPSNVEDICKYAFANCEKLSCVNLMSLLACDCDPRAFEASDGAKLLHPYYGGVKMVQKEL